MMLYKKMTLLVGVIYFSSTSAWAASCCGGGSASSLIMPKFSKAMVDISVDIENYDGYWDGDGIYHADPPGADLNQYRVNVGYAKRLAPRWQASAIIPYVWNSNQYIGLTSNTQGQGDMTLNLMYEAFDNIKCIWKARSWEDLIPAVYYGVSLTVPTGISPYGNVSNSFDITGRGFYRLDGSILLDKTIYPWNFSLLFSYGKYLERYVNREYGNYVEPYKKNLGDRMLGTATVGYTLFLDSMDTLTFSLAYSHLQEDTGTIDGRTDYASEMMKNSITSTFAYATMDRDWVFKGSWNHALPYNGQGKNFSVTDVFTFGVSYVLR